MKIVITGATGFVGRHLAKILLERRHELTIVGRDPAKADEFFSPNRVTHITGDIYDLSVAQIDEIAQADVVAHLAWPGLPNYHELFHLEDTLPKEMIFLKAILARGLHRLLVTGTCFEYGLQDGCLEEERTARPVTAYGRAKDNLRSYLEFLSGRYSFSLIWARLFYLHGLGQHPGSILAQLDRAIDAGAQRFPMSMGEQLRDYLPVTEATEQLANLLECNSATGIINVCSGSPLSIRRLVEERIAERCSDIQPLFGHYTYPAHEPMAFWGNPEKYRNVAIEESSR